MGTVYEALGSNIDVVEFLDQLIPAADKDIMKVFMKDYKDKFNIMLETKVTAVEAKDDGLYVTFEGKNAPSEQVRYDKVLVAVGRKPNGKLVGADAAGVNVDDRGFINVDKQMRTNVDHIFAIGDLVGQPMLAHKAVHEGHVAAEVIAGQKHYFDPRGIPSVAYTEPEVAWVGLNEEELTQRGVDYRIGKFPFMANGRAKVNNTTDGFVKILADTRTDRILGVHIVGPEAGNMIAEAAVAMEFGGSAEDLARTCHAHPTLTEAVKEAALAVEDRAIHM